MFTGIVEEVGTVRSVAPNRLVIGASKVMEDLAIGDSISVNGACLTAVARDGASFAVDVVAETLRRTNLGSLDAGDGVNLERALRADARFGGHVVQGHVDGTGTVMSVTQGAGDVLVRFDAPPGVMRYVVEKGFIAVDGTSLTVVDCAGHSFTVALIPFTSENTVLGSRREGDSVNLEADIFAKYLERFSATPRLPIDVADEL